MNFINRLKNAEHKFFCIGREIYKSFEDNEYDKLYEVLSTLENKKIKINNILIEKYEDMLENLDLEQDISSRTAIDIYKIGHNSIRLLKWLAYYDRSYYENIICYDLMGSISNLLNEISQL